MKPMSQMSAQPSTRLILLLCVSVPSFMINLDANIVAVSLPAIARSLHADFASIEWVVSAYTLTFACLVLPAGALADRYGRKAILVLGLAIFTGASFVCGAAPSAAVLNSARALQGVGAALQLSAALAILSHSFSGAERARAFAFWGAVVGIAITLGPVAGGIITQALGWQWVFFINLPVGVLLILLTLYAVAESKDPNARGIDAAGVIVFSGAIFALTLALISGNARGWSSAPILGEFAAAAVLMAAFVVVEWRQDRPMIDLGLFRRATFLGANIAGLAFAGTLLTMLTYLPIYFQSGLGYGPQGAGFLMLPLVVPLFVVPRLVAAHLTHRMSGRTLLTVGLIFVAVGLAALAVAVPNFRYGGLVAGLFVSGIGAGVLNGEVVKTGMTVIPPERAGMASGVSGTVRFTGIVVGFAALGAVLAGRIQGDVRAALANLGPHIDAMSLVHQVVAGDLSGAAATAAPDLHDAVASISRASFGDGYSAILLVAAGFALVSAGLTWSLVRSADTAATGRSSNMSPSVAPIE